jgi:hypothetical protein
LFNSLASVGSDWFNIQQLADSLDQFFDFKRLLHEVVGSRIAEFLDFVLLDHSADTDNLAVVERRVATNALTDLATINVGQHDIQYDDVRVVLFDHHSSIEAVVGCANVKSTVRFEYVLDQFDQFLIVINDQCLAPSAFQSFMKR